MTDLAALSMLPAWEWPEDASETLLHSVDQGREESERLLAVELAGQAMTDELARALLDLVGDPDEPDALRARAAIALGPILEYLDLGEFDAPYPDNPCSEATARRIRKELRNLYHDAGVPRDVRRRILEASVRAPDDWHPEAVRTRWASGEQPWRVTAVFCMGYVAGFEDEIMEALGSDDPELRFEAVRAAGGRGLDPAWREILDLLESRTTPRNLLLAAIDAAESLGHGEDDLDIALGELMDSDDDEIADAAAEVLEMRELWNDPPREPL